MSDLQSTFYLIGIIYMIINLLLLIAVGVGIIFIFRSVMEMRKKVEEKLKYVENVIRHPEDVIADIGASLIRKSFQGIKRGFKRGNTASS